MAYDGYEPPCHKMESINRPYAELRKEADDGIIPLPPDFRDETHRRVRKQFELIYGYIQRMDITALLTGR